MSAEQSINIKNFKTHTIDIHKKNIAEKTKSRVDINYLLIKLREKEKLQKQENFLFIGIISSIIVTMGIIVTL